MLKKFKFKFFTKLDNSFFLSLTCHLFFFFLTCQKFSFFFNTKLKSLPYQIHLCNWFQNTQNSIIVSECVFFSSKKKKYWFEKSTRSRGTSTLSTALYAYVCVSMCQHFTTWKYPTAVEMIFSSSFFCLSHPLLFYFVFDIYNNILHQCQAANVAAPRHSVKCHTFCLSSTCVSVCEETM